jgi:hypothetical protein
MRAILIGVLPRAACWSHCSFLLSHSSLGSLSRLFAILFLATSLLSSPAHGASAGTALRFDGLDDYATVPHAAELNAYPLTITAWVKTARNAPLYDGILTKYAPGSGNGYSLHLYNGRLRAWYFRDSINRVYTSDPGMDGGFIADGNWHHVAFVVTANGGTLFVDGSLSGQLGWSGAPGPTTSASPVIIGRYSTIPEFSNAFDGEIDELTVWNRALTGSEINYLKHRRLGGKEDGLLANWRFDEGNGTAVMNSAADRFHALTMNGPAWVDSKAAVALQPVAANGLRFNGTSGFVQVAHHANLNAYPLTAAGWFRTTNSANVVQGIVSKYQDASGNGWAIMVVNGRLRGFYYRTLANVAIDVTATTPVADGGWHHAAMVVDASGGRLFLDGVQVGSSSWAGAPGASTSTEPLQIGRYHNYTQHFHGALDEISVWNRAFTASEIQAMRNLPLAGNEANLVGYWRLDEGMGTTTADSTGNGHQATLINSPVWIGSTAYLGDGSVHMIVAPGIPTFTRSFAIATAPGKESFIVSAPGSLRRFHDFGTAPPAVSVSVQRAIGLQIAGVGTPIAVQPVTFSSNLSVGAYNASAPRPATAASGYAALAGSANARPAAGVQLESVNHLHQAVVMFSHNEGGGVFVDDGTALSSPTRLLHFNGMLMFDSVPTVITDISNVPAAGTVSPPTHLQTQLQLPANAAHIAAHPGLRFGGGAVFNVRLNADGTATNLNGSFETYVGVIETANVGYEPGWVRLTATGAATTGELRVYLPAGLGFSISPANNRILQTELGTYPNTVTLDAALRPVSDLTFTAAAFGVPALHFSEESVPFWITSSQIEWRVNDGEFQLAQAASLQFVRQIEDDALAARRGELVNPLAGDRVSNDGYFNNVAAVAGVPVVIRADDHGVARLSMEAQIAASEYRPHFPYLNRNTGGHVPITGGPLVVVDGDVDTTASYLSLGNTVPVPYARDCAPDTACPNPTTVGAQVLQFDAQGNQLKFTRDGGLFAFGSIAPTDLTWGFLGGGNYAQRTSNVQEGAYHVAGRRLRGDQTGVASALRPAVLLFTGVGDASNPDSIERPGTTAYRNGFANYAGLNFRAPGQGRSIIANQDSGWYPLTPRAKYYVRFGGVSGIHESATFPSNLLLYGYPFTFQSYRLSFLDSDNWESRTDGMVSLPYPSAFDIEFERMKFLCRGNLDSARLPATIGMKELAYWNVDIKPMSLQFKPRAGNGCSLTERYLVLGVETKLPLIPQALHATLAFQTNGNLATRATAVEGVDSRFAVPAQLTLQGPGGSVYPLTTAAQGYFNNWETPGRPETGFYNLVGRLRVPFFQDVKVHLHVTPTAAGTGSQIAMMGGWAADDGHHGHNHGWRVGSKDYFNNPAFDPHHNGWPSEVTLARYHSSTSEAFRPRARRDWIGVAKFDYPLAWNSVLREFAGYADAKVILPVIDVNSRLKQITPGKVDLDFAQDLNVQLPRIKLLDFANDALNEINAPINTLSNAVRQALGGALNTAGLTSGFRSLQDVLRENAEGFFRPVLEASLDPVVDNLYNALAAELINGKNSLLSQTPTIVSANNNGLRDAISGINGTAGQANKIFGQLNRTLMDADATLGLFIRILEKDGSGNRHVVRVVIQKVAQDQGPALGFVANLGDQLVNGLLRDLEPTLAKIESDLRQLRSQFTTVRQQIATSGGDFSAALHGITQNATAVQNYLQLAGGSVSDLLSSAVGPANDYFTADPARAKREIRERLVMAFLNSQLTGQYQSTFRQFLFDQNALLNQLMNVLFDQVNRSIRDGLTAQIAGAQDGVFQNLKGSGLMSGSLASAKIRGSPTFQGDSLRMIHLDADVKMNLPDEMNFTAYLIIKELNSQSTPLSCIPAGGPAAEVTLGARDVPLDWLGVTGGTPLTLSVAARWTLQETAVLGIGGSFEVKGKAGFKGCSLNDFGASLAIGQTESYFAAKAGATVLVLGIPVDFNAGIFAGKACSLDPLIFVDPEAQQVLNDPLGFSGVYLNFGGGLSLSDILFGTSSCLLDVRASIGTALYYQGGPRFGTIGGRQKTALDIDLLCVLSAHVDWAVFIVIDTSGQLTVGGSANVCGKIGICPVCVKGCKGVTVKGVVNDGGIDYFIDW